MVAAIRGRGYQYMGRLLQKEHLFSGFRYVEGQGIYKVRYIDAIYGCIIIKHFIINFISRL